MSTRASLIYSHTFGLHIYQELLDSTVHVEIDGNGLSINAIIGTYEEWVTAGHPTRMTLDGANAVSNSASDEVVKLKQYILELDREAQTGGTRGKI